MHGRVAFYLPSMGGGGAERAIVTLANGLARRARPVDLVLVQAQGPYLAEVDPAVRVIDLRRKRVLTSLFSLARYLRRHKPAALISAMTHANIVAVAARMIARSSTRLLLSERTSLAGLRGELGPMRYLGMKTLMRWFYPRADGVIAVAEAMASELREMLPIDPDRVMLVHNPVVSDEMLELSGAAPPHEWLLDAAVPVVLAVGRLGIEKDYATLIAAFARVRETRPLRLLILGEGAERANLIALAEKLGVADDCALPGFCANPFSAMSRASLFVLSSRYEGLPNALIQAMACGARVIATDCPTGPREILQDGRWGTLVPIGDSDAMAEAMIETLNQTNFLDVRKRASEFGVHHAISRIVDVIEQRLEVHVFSEGAVR